MCDGLAISEQVKNKNPTLPSNSTPVYNLQRRRRWHPTPVLLPGKSHGWRSLVGCSHGVAKSRTGLSDFTFTFHFHALEVKAMVFPVVMYGRESWTIKKAEHRRIDAFELWCWRKLLRVPWTARRSNQSILKETSPGSKE